MGWPATMPSYEPWGQAMRRRDFIKAFASVATACPFVASAQQAPLPVIGFVNAGSADGSVGRATAFLKGLGEAGYVDGQNVKVEYHWLEGKNERLPAIMADLVRREVAVIATPGSVVCALAAKAATQTIPIVFGVPEDPVKLRLVANLARPGGNATGVNSFSQETIGKRLRLLHDLIPKAIRIALLLNPDNASSTEATSREVKNAADQISLKIQVLNAKTISEIDSAFDLFTKDRPDALFVAPDAFFNSRGAQFATLTARERLASAFSDRTMVAAGGLMSYGADLIDMARQVGVYSGTILKGAKPADLPVLQSTKLQFAINLHTAHMLGLDLPSGMLSIADEVIE
jgi:putative ABC transport system substrate-binding protein